MYVYLQLLFQMFSSFIISALWKMICSQVVKLFREAGAVIVGTTAMTEFGVTPLGYSAHHRGPFNAYDPKHYPLGALKSFSKLSATSQDCHRLHTACASCARCSHCACWSCLPSR